MTLEERIKQMLEESTKTVEATLEVVAEEELDEAQRFAKETGKKYNDQTGQYIGGKNYDKLAAKQGMSDLLKKSSKAKISNVKEDSQVSSKFKAPMKKKSITEEDLEEMTQEEFDSIDEEQLDELSSGLVDAVRAKRKQNLGSAIHNYNDQEGAHGPFSAQAKKAGAVKYNAADKLNKNTNLTFKPKLTKESSEVSSQVASLLEAEGLSKEFKVQAVTIFEAAVSDRVMQLQEELEAEYNEKLDEARAEVEQNIDGFLNEAVAKWAENNEVAIQSNFKTRLAESFMDGLQSLLAEHNIDLPAESESALDIALDEVSKLQEEADAVEATISDLQEQVAALKSEKILESFKDRMAATEFDRFSQLTESIKFVNENQYEKQLNIVLENFGKKIKDTRSDKETMITESASTNPAKVVETFNSVQRYAQFMSKAKK